MAIGPCGNTHWEGLGLTEANCPACVQVNLKARVKELERERAWLIEQIALGAIEEEVEEGLTLESAEAKVIDFMRAGLAKEGD